LKIRQEQDAREAEKKKIEEERKQASLQIQTEKALLSITKDEESKMSTSSKSPSNVDFTVDSPFNHGLRSVDFYDLSNVISRHSNFLVRENVKSQSTEKQRAKSELRK
jgi:hypothetical protein